MKFYYMDKELLYRFFSGKTSDEEETLIRKWTEYSEENYRSLLKERKIFDSLLLTTPLSLQREKSRNPIIFWKIFTAAAISLLLIVSGIYLFHLKESSIQYTTLLVPPGQRINLILADQTNVWLNANTKFRYPTEFSKKNRTVYLDGEAYFEVSKNQANPFIVQTGQGDVKVTGTSFNVEAYSKYHSFKTSLFTGSVDIYKNEAKLATLHPNEKSSLENNELIVSKITETDDYLWRKGLIAFNNESLEEILYSLEKYFDVKIEIVTSNLPRHTYTGKFRQSDGIDYALRVLRKSIHFTYERDEETGTIYIK